jgi:phage-related minor tail protein
MSDTTTETTDEAQEAETGAEERTTEDPRISKANAEAAKYRKELRTAQTELEKVRKAGLSEQEKAVTEAEQRGAQNAAAKVGARLVRAEFRAAAAGQVDKDTLSAYLEDVDLSKFLDDDGEPDTKAIEARIKRLGGGKATDFDGGARTPAGKPADMNSLIRRQAGMG